MKHFLLIGSIFAWVILQAWQELMLNRIDPFDGALFAANGAFFLSAASDFGQFISKPVDWLYSYYNQYPALALRRHPPLFGVAELFVYFFTGVSVFGAKLTGLLYALAAAAGIYALSYRLWRDALLATATAFLIMATPQIAWLSTAVRLDLPALTFVIWAIFHYVGYARTDSRLSAIWFAILVVLSIYTYQLAFFVVAGACLHLLIYRRTTIFKDKTIWLVFALLLGLLLPLLIEQVYVAMDNIKASFGGDVEAWKRFQPIENRMSFEFFLYYPKVWLNSYPVQTAGLVLWAVSAWRRGIDRDEILLLLCAGGAILFFSWARGKDPRYAVYTMIPLGLLATKAIRDLFLGSAGDAVRRTRHRAAAAGIIALGMVQAYAAPSPAYSLSGMELPAQAVMAQPGAARILYAGPRDAAFVFYVRENDPNRRARVYRATVQISAADELAEFVQKEGINVLIWEDGDGRKDYDGYGKFRDALEQFVGTQAAFRPLEAFTLYHRRGGAPTQQIKLNVFMKKTENSAMPSL